MPSRMQVSLMNTGFVLHMQTHLDISDANNWDDTGTTDYTVPANRAGVDFYIYACQPDQGKVPKILVSPNSTVPTGYTAASSRKIGGFHCLCADVGTITGHPLSGYLAGDILPASVWDLKFRPYCDPAGMVYDSKRHVWVDIYLISGTGFNTAPVFGGTISDNRSWPDFVDDLLAVGKRLPTDLEFQSLAIGSNEETNIDGSADPVTTGSHSDTAARRMVSNIGCEDCCGAMMQWLWDQSFRVDGIDFVTPADPSWAWSASLGNKGALYRQGTAGDVKLVAGGAWSNGSYCGSRCRDMGNNRGATSAVIGGRGVCEHKEVL